MNHCSHRGVLAAGLALFVATPSGLADPGVQRAPVERFALPAGLHVDGHVDRSVDPHVCDLGLPCYAPHPLWGMAAAAGPGDDPVPLTIELTIAAGWDAFLLRGDCWTSWWSGGGGTLSIACGGGDEEAVPSHCYVRIVGSGKDGLWASKCGKGKVQYQPMLGILYLVGFHSLD